MLRASALSVVSVPFFLLCCAGMFSCINSRIFASSASVVFTSSEMVSESPSSFTKVTLGASFKLGSEEPKLETPLHELFDLLLRQVALFSL